MKRFFPSLVLAGVLVSHAHAGGFSFSPEFTAGDFESLAASAGDVLAFPNLATAGSTGVAGFAILAASGGPQIDNDAGWFRNGLDASTVGGVLAGHRIILRKGLAAHLDVGAQVGTVAGERFLGGEVRWAFLPGGVLEPAAALRATYSRLQGAPVELDVTEGQLVISKGFVVVSPYAALGYRRVTARARFGEPVPFGHSVVETRGTATVGAKLTFLPVLHVIGEVRRASKSGVFVGIGLEL